MHLSVTMFSRNCSPNRSNNKNSCYTSQLKSVFRLEENVSRARAMGQNSLAVYHLHGETGWSMVCENGKQNSHIGNFRMGWRGPFEQQTQLTERAWGDFDIFKMAAEIVVFNGIIDASIDEELLLAASRLWGRWRIPLNISHCSFMKRDLKRIAGFCEVVVPSYAIAEFRSHFRLTKTTFEVLAHWKTEPSAAAMLTHPTWRR